MGRSLVRLAVIIGALTAVSCHSAGRSTAASGSAKSRVIFGRTVRLKFQGNNALSDAELRAVVSIDKAGDESPRDTLDRDVLLLNATYYDHGYLMIRIGEPVITEATDGAFVDVLIPIQKEGPRMQIGRLSIFERDEAGQPIAPLGNVDLRTRITSPDGSWFARDVLVRDLSALRTFYRDQGYANVEANPETEIDEAHARVDIVIPVVRGPVVHIERIVVVGLKTIPKSRIVRELTLAEAELFNETKLEQSRARLRALPGVRSVDVSTANGTDAAHIIVTIEVAER
jgi:outer membrane protein insertion porin family